MKAWIVTHPDYEGGGIIHAETRSKARYQVWLHATNAGVPIHLIELKVSRMPEFDDIKITTMRSCHCEICNGRE